MPNSQAYNDVEVEDHSATNHAHDNENQHVNQGTSVTHQVRFQPCREATARYSKKDFSKVGSQPSSRQVACCRNSAGVLRCLVVLGQHLLTVGAVGVSLKHLRTI